MKFDRTHVFFGINYKRKFQNGYAMSRKIPVFLEPTKNRKIVVFGGGNVAFRKCKQFDGYYITVVAEKVVPGMVAVCDEIILEHFDVRNLSKYLTDAFVAVAATDDKKLNQDIVDCARNTGCMVNSAHGRGDLLLPSVVRRNGFAVAVSSEGSVPAFPPYVAKQIDSMLGPEYELMMKLLVDLRNGLQSRVFSQPKRAEFLAEILANEKIWDCIRNNSYAAAKTIADEIESKYHEQ